MQDTRLPEKARFTPEQLEVRRKWREALRSGKYQQGQGYLRDGDNKFCCLGVLCDLVEPSGWTASASAIGGRYQAHRSKAAVPSDHIKEAAGIDLVWPFTDANDNLGKSFAEIADMIEQEEAAA